MFVGVYELAIDAKNRLSIPYLLRSKLNAETDGRSFYFLPGWQRGTLAVFPDLLFERMRKGRPPLERLSSKTIEWLTFELAQCALVDPDTQGRVLIPERLLKRVGISRQAVLTGADDHMVLWSPEAFQEFEGRMWPDYIERRDEANEELRSRADAASSAASSAVGGSTQWQEMH